MTQKKTTAQPKKRIKVSEEERTRRKSLDLPVTKPLRYMRYESGKYVEYPVVDYEIVEVYQPSGTPSLSITLNTGEHIRILSLYFSEMQKPSFVDDVEKIQEEEE